MKKKIILAVLMMLSFAFLPGKASFAAVELGHDRACEIDDEIARQAAGCDESEVKDVGKTALDIINLVIAVLGLVAVLFVVIGGVQYTMSQGDPTKTKKAKDTILYAILGVALALLAYAIVNFVIARLTNQS